MNIQKKLEYPEKMNLYGIDTLSGYIPRRVKETEYNLSTAKVNINQCNYKVDEEKTYLLINPNKQGEGESLITKYSDFVKKMEHILDSVGVDLNEYDVIRADFCFNSTDTSTYNSYQKLHRLLISCLAKAYKYKNCYVSCGLWDFERLSIAIKKDDSEVENYNKHRESEGKDESANRLEFRSKRMSGTSIEYQFMTKWFERLDKARNCFNDVQTEYNNHLESLYKNDIVKPPRERSYLSLNAFLLQHKETIYTRKQMIDLLSRFDEVKNPTKRADKFKDKHRIEYFSQKDLEYIIEVLKEKTTQYFNS
jgi:hypothetical protein